MATCELCTAPFRPPDPKAAEWITRYQADPNPADFTFKLVKWSTHWGLVIGELFAHVSVVPGGDKCTPVQWCDRDDFLRGKTPTSSCFIGSKTMTFRDIEAAVAEVASGIPPQGLVHDCRAWSIAALVKVGFADRELASHVASN